jgi:pimeloyl-ACP methyl ester carboxylesterase
MRNIANTCNALAVRAIAFALAMSVVMLLSACGRSLPPRAAPDPANAQSAVDHYSHFTAGEIRGLSHPHFERTHAKAGLWEPLATLEEIGAGIYFLEPYDPKRIPVLFVHGMGGTPRDFRNMIESLDRSRFQVWVFHYPTGLRLPVVARILHGLVNGLRSKHGFDALFITAHSAGGLVSRGYLMSIRGNGDHSIVKLLVTFSSPWDGHRWAAVGAQYAPSPVPSWIDLSPGSDFLTSLREPLQHLGRPVPHHVFYGFRRSPSILMTESSDGVVAVASQLPLWVQEQAERCWGFDADHVEILSNGAALKRYALLLKLEADRLPRSHR